jgi:hypothetical protein
MAYLAKVGLDDFYLDGRIPQVRTPIFCAMVGSGLLELFSEGSKDSYQRLKNYMPEQSELIVAYRDEQNKHNKRASGR